MEILGLEGENTDEKWTIVLLGHYLIIHYLGLKWF
jgi:hypothetical protein